MNRLGRCFRFIKRYCLSKLKRCPDLPTYPILILWSSEVLMNTSLSIGCICKLGHLSGLLRHYLLSNLDFGFAVQIHLPYYMYNSSYNVKGVAVSCGYDTWFAVRLVMDYTASHFAWSILGYLLDPNRSSLPEPEIVQIHLSSDAQCVSHHYPRWTATTCMTCNMWRVNY